MVNNRKIDQELVERVKKGDKKAFDVLVLKYQQRILNLVSRYIQDSAEIHDVSQEAFIKAYRALPNFRGDSAFYTWLYTIASNTAKNFLAARKRRPPQTGVEAEIAEQIDSGWALQNVDTPEELLHRQEVIEVIQDAVNALPDELRIAISLREMDGLSYEEIAQTMDCPVGTVRSRIFRARDAIDKKIKPLLSSVGESK